MAEDQNILKDVSLTIDEDPHQLHAMRLFERCLPGEKRPMVKMMFSHARQFLDQITNKNERNPYVIAEIYFSTLPKQAFDVLGFATAAVFETMSGLSFAAGDISPEIFGVISALNFTAGVLATSGAILNSARLKNIKQYKNALVEAVHRNELREDNPNVQMGPLAKAFMRFEREEAQRHREKTK